MDPGVIDFPGYDVGDDPRRALIAFLDSVEDLLNEIVTSNRDPKGEILFKDELLEDMSAAWDDTREHFSGAREKISQLTEETLWRHGLSGAPLRFKLHLVRLFFQRYVSAGKEALPKLLKVILDILNSLLDGVPGGHAIAEMLTAITNALGA